MKHIFIVGCALIALTIGTFVDATSDLIQEETTPSIPGAEALVAPSPDGPITHRDLIAINIITTFVGAYVPEGYSERRLVVGDPQLYGPTGITISASGDYYIAQRWGGYISKVDKITDVMTIFAGRGPVGYSGDGGPATDATLNEPTYTAFDASGNLYIVDYGNSVIRMVDINGDISTVVGTGMNTDSGDNGPALLAGLYDPNGIAFDSRDNLYISTNNKIRVVDQSSQIISTVVGTGNVGYSGGFGFALGADLHAPQGIAFDSLGNLWFADSGNHVIRMVDLAAGIIQTVIGTGESGYNGDGLLATDTLLGFLPNSVTFDLEGNPIVTDTGNHIIRKVDKTTRIVSPIAGISVIGITPSAGLSGDGGDATLAQFNQPTQVAIDSLGRIYVADYVNDKVRLVAPYMEPIIETSTPTAEPTHTPTAAPTPVPTSSLSLEPPSLPSSVPTATLCFEPTVRPSKKHGKCKADH